MNIDTILEFFKSPLGLTILTAMIPLATPLVTLCFTFILSLVIKVIYIIDNVIIDVIKKIIPPIGSMLQTAYVNSLVEFRDNLNVTIEKVKD